MIQAKKRFGQNFLHDEAVLSKIIQAIPKELDKIVEIGVGLGDLTQRLLEISRVKAYEIDAELMPFLTKKFQKQLKDESLELLCEDASKAFTPSLDTQEYFLVANLPYYIASKLILQALQDTNCKGLLVMVQKELALKFCAKSGESDFSALSVLSALICQREVLFEVPPQSFTPMPKVVSSVMFLQKRREFSEICEIYAFEDFLKDCFKAPRKQLISNLKPLKAQLLECLERLNLKANIRAHELSVESFLEIYKNVKDYYGAKKRQHECEKQQALSL